MYGRLLVIAGLLAAASLGMAQSAGTPESSSPRYWVGIDPLHIDPRSEQAVAALDGLIGAFNASGLPLAASQQEADVRVELAGQRMVGGGRGALPSRFHGDAREVALIRATVAHGDDIVEVRGRSTESNRPWRSAAVEVVRGVQQALTGGVFGIGSGRAVGRLEHVDAAAPAPLHARTPELLSLVQEFVARYQRSFAAVVADERYQQVYWQRRLPYPSPLQATRRDLQSEMGFTFFPGASMWFGFRDVIHVDGEPVAARNRALRTLLLDRRIPSAQQFRQVAESSARFNIGPATRNFNVPTTPLLFASPEHRHRSQFELVGFEPNAAAEVAILAFTETARPTLISRNGHDRPSRGLLWVSTASGQIRRTDLAISEQTIDARLTTWFAYDRHTGMTVPTKMREVYDFIGRFDEYVETSATYTNFRRFETTTRIRP